MSIAASNVLNDYPVSDTASARTQTRHQATTLIVVNGNPDESTRRKILRDMEKRSNVVSASFIRQKPAMLLVGYHPEREQVVNILHAINQSDFVAKRVC